MIQVREYAVITADPGANPTMDVGQVSGATFEWLINLHNQWEQDSKLIIRNGKKYLKLGSYIGYLQSPSGEGIEILPKTEFASPEEPESLRMLLQDMLGCSASLESYCQIWCMTIRQRSCQIDLPPVFHPETARCPRPASVGQTP